MFCAQKHNTTNPMCENNGKCEKGEIMNENVRYIFRNIADRFQDATAPTAHAKG